MEFTCDVLVVGGGCDVWRRHFQQLLVSIAVQLHWPNDLQTKVREAVSLRLGA